MESSRPRDWTHVLTLAGRFLTTKLPGKSPEVQVWFLPAQLFTPARCLPIAPDSASPTCQSEPGSFDLLLLFPLNRPLVTDSGPPWGSASCLKRASPLSLGGLCLPPRPHWGSFSAPPVKMVFYSFVQQIFINHLLCARPTDTKPVSANPWSSLGDTCPRGRVCLRPTRGVPAGLGPPWALLLENPVLLLRPSCPGGRKGAHPQGWTWLSTPLHTPSGCWAGCQRLGWGKPPHWGPLLRRVLTPVTSLL